MADRRSGGPEKGPMSMMQLGMQQQQMMSGGPGSNMMGDGSMMGMGQNMMMGGQMMGGPNMMGGGHNMMGNPNMMGAQNMMGGSMMMPNGGNMMGGQNMMGGNDMMMWNQPYVEPVNMGVGMDPMMQMQAAEAMAPDKQPFYFKTVTLLPPERNKFHQSTRARPSCCHTVFVGGLPENVTMDHLKEVFSKCGNINNLRINKKHFAHIRFDNQETVDHAIYLSGYRMVLHVDDKPSEEKENTGRMFVDFADDREDKYLAECVERQQAREKRHRERQENERNRPPSPKPVISYSLHNMNRVSDDVKCGEKLTESLDIIISWLDRGDCVKSSVNLFYGIIQSVNVQVRRLHSDKTTMETEINELRDKFRLSFEGILHQLGQIDQVYISATKQKAWDNFTKAQRKNIQAWQKQVQATYKMLQADYAKLYQSSEEMDMSDDEMGDNSGPSSSKMLRSDNDMVEMAELRMKNSSLGNELDAYKNEVMVLKLDIQSGDNEKNTQIRSLQQALQGMQHQLMMEKQNTRIAMEKVNRTTVVSEEDKDKETTAEDGENDDNNAEKVDTPPAQPEFTLKIEDRLSIPLLGEPLSQQELNVKQAKLIGLVSCFLNVHPNGASIDYIWSYLNQVDMVVTTREIEDILLKYPTMFIQQSHGVGAFLERRWHLALFNVKLLSTTTR